MQISKRTIEVLKNFATINQSIVVTAGNKLKTMAMARNILAEAEVAENFETEFAIYNLNEFLAALSLFQEPELSFEERYVNIREKGAKRGGIKYFYANKALIVHPTKPLRMPEGIDAEFTVNEAQLLKLQKAANVLNVNDMVVVGDSEGISLIVQDRKNDSSNDFEVQVSEAAQAKPFKFYFKQENLKLIPGEYQVKIAGVGIASFQRTDATIQYAIALEAE